MIQGFDFYDFLWHTNMQESEYPAEMQYSRLAIRFFQDTRNPLKRGFILSPLFGPRVSDARGSIDARRC